MFMKLYIFLLIQFNGNLDTKLIYVLLNLIILFLLFTLHIKRFCMLIACFGILKIKMHILANFFKN